MPTTPKKYRIATDRATGIRYYVHSLEFPRDGSPVRAHLFGRTTRANENVKTGGARCWHTGIFTVDRDTVDVSDPTPRTFELALEIYAEQNADHHRRRGFVFYRKSKDGARNIRFGIRPMTEDELIDAAAGAEDAGDVELAMDLLDIADRRANDDDDDTTAEDDGTWTADGITADDRLNRLFDAVAGGNYGKLF